MFNLLSVTYQEVVAPTNLMAFIFMLRNEKIQSLLRDVCLHVITCVFLNINNSNIPHSSVESVFS